MRSVGFHRVGDLTVFSRKAGTAAKCGALCKPCPRAGVDKKAGSPTRGKMVDCCGGVL